MSNRFDRITQVFLPTLTIIGFSFTSAKRPEIGLPINDFAQIFWVYSGYLAWKKAGQLGIFITTVVTTIIFFFGVINYWLL